MGFQRSAMSVPKPPFHTASEELLYNIYLKIQNVETLRESDISTLAKLNALITDADLLGSAQVMQMIDALKGNVPEAANTLEKIYAIVNALSFLKASDIDTLEKFNTILRDADLMDATGVLAAINAVKGNVPEAGNTLEKIYAIITALPFLKAADIDTLGKLNAVLGDADLMDGKDVLAAIQALKGNVPEAGNTLEKIHAIITALPFLKAADIDTLAKLNAVLMDADLMDGKDILAAIDGVKGNVDESANTLAKLHELLKPILKAWVSGGNRFGEEVPLGTLDGFALPFITGSVERGRFDADGKFLIGHAELGMGKFHIRSDDASIDGYSAYID